MIPNYNNARKILHDWVGEGGQPVPINQAQARANVCHPCPYHYSGEWQWNIATAIAIAAQKKLKETMNIRVEGEESLKVCEKCGCCLRIKIHVPFKHIYRHTSDQLFEKFPSHCWITQELSEYKKHQ